MEIILYTLPALIGSVLVLMYVLWEVKQQKRTPEDTVGQLYMMIWNGTKADRIYAWQRVIAHLEAWNYDRHLIEECRQRIQRMRQQEWVSETFVNVNGKLVQSREVS